jgi:hypothetical protein
MKIKRRKSADDWQKTPKIIETNLETSQKRRKYGADQI